MPTNQQLPSAPGDIVTTMTTTTTEIRRQPKNTLSTDATIIRVLSYFLATLCFLIATFAAIGPLEDAHHHDDNFVHGIVFWYTLAAALLLFPHYYRPRSTETRHHEILPAKPGSHGHKLILEMNFTSDHHTMAYDVTEIKNGEDTGDKGKDDPSPAQDQEQAPKAEEQQPQGHEKEEEQGRKEDPQHNGEGTRQILKSLQFKDLKTDQGGKANRAGSTGPPPATQKAAKGGNKKKIDRSSSVS
ncbi:MAG: hypothetical protein Q9159_004476 [Coniocarpon cinnabarinum]